MASSRDTQRKDSFFTEAQILLTIHNLLITHNAIAWEITQTDLCEMLKLGERTVQRVTKRLEELGLLHRVAGQGQASYIYSIPDDAIRRFLAEMVFTANLFVVQDSFGRLLLFEDFDAYWEAVVSMRQNES